MKKILVTTLLLLTGVAHAQTNTENYIQTRVYLEPTATTSTSARQTQSIQYFDGLGRAVQGIAVKASPTGKDIVSYIEYDAFGRQTKNYLPVPQAGTQNGEIYTSPLGNASTIYGGEKIYSESLLENSPLNRVQQQIQVGNDWSTKPVTFGYDANADGEVKKYTTTTNWTESRTQNTLNLSGNYPTGTLYKTSVTDEDGNRTEEFKNKKGQILLVRKNTETGNADTYYIYNEYGQLVYTLPPLAVQNTAPDETALNTLCYQYRYDSWNRLVEKKIPGKGWEYMVYDKQDRLVLSQDANMREKGQWLFTKYDKFSRPIYTGILDSPPGRTQQIVAIEGYGSNNEARSTSSWNNSGVDVYYTNNLAYPISNFKILSINYYDIYPTGTPTIPTQILGQNVLPQSPQSSGVSTKSLPVASYVKNIEDDNWTKNYIWYDTKGRSIGGHTINHLGGYTKTESQLDFAGVTKNTTLYHVRKANEKGVIIKQRFIYDTQNRLLQHYHQVDSRTEQLLTQNEYNELSQLKNKKVGDNLQSVDYSYNIKGLLTDINKDQMSLPNLGGKLFSYKIKYTQKEGITNPDVAFFSGKDVKAKYNGSITEVDWRAVETLGVNPSSTPKRYGYAYDQLNRLTAGYYQNPSNPYSKENIESLAYDLNGNITNLYRTSVLETGTNTATVIDKLAYTYNGNKVTNINDNSQNPSGYEGGGNTIGYDLNGNMLSMPDKGIFPIQYNYLDLPNHLVLTKNGSESITINTKYSADGTKLAKESTTVLTGVAGSTTTKKTTDYIDGFQYLKTENIGGGGSTEILMTNALSRRAMQPQTFTPIGPIDPTIDPPLGGGGGIIIDEKTADLQFFPTTEGFYDYGKDQYIYQYVDHLGNTRISFARNSAGALEITDNNDYYPFGMNHLKTGNAFFGTGSYQSFKYNGKELQETGMYSYGWREYMPDIAKWNGIDQLAESYAFASPYAYVANNPISFTDPDGRWIDDAGNIVDTSGNPFYFNGQKRHLINFSFADTQGNSGGGGNSSGNSGLSQSFIDKAFKFGGVWTNTGGSSFSNGQNLDLDYEGNLTSTLGTYIDIPRIHLTGSSTFWGLNSQIKFNSFMGRFNAKSDFAWDRFQNAGRYNDRGVMMIGGAKDPLGFFDIGGQILSTMEPENRYAAMAVGLFAAVAAKKPGLAAKVESNTLIHYTSEAGYKAIMESGQLLPSIGIKNARYGSGQYLTDLLSEGLTKGQVSRKLFGVPWNTKSVSHFIEIDVKGLNVIKNAPNNFLVPNSNGLPLNGIIVNHGSSIFKP